MSNLILPRELEKKSLALRITRTPVTFKTAAFVLMGAFVFLTLVLSALPWQQTSRASGRVVAYSPTDREQKIDAPVEGRLGRWFVQEGSRVKEGDPIVELLDNDPEILSRLRAERDAVQRRLDAARVSSRASKVNVERQKELYKSGLSAQRAFELAEIEYARQLSDEANASAELSRIEVRLAR